MEDVTQTFLFTTNGDAPKYLYLDEGHNQYIVMPEFEDFFQEFWDYKTGDVIDYTAFSESATTTNKEVFGTQNSYLTLKKMYLANLCHLWYLVKDATWTDEDSFSINGDFAKSFVHIFGLENPKATPRVVWAIRNRGNSIRFKKGNVVKEGTEEYQNVKVVCLSCEKQDKRSFSNDDLENAPLKYDLDVWVNGTDRFNLGYTTGFIVLANKDAKNRWNVIRTLPITSFISSQSIRFDRVFYPDETSIPGECYNTYAFTHDLVIEDVITIGNIKIVSFLSRNRYYEAGYGGTGLRGYGNRIATPSTNPMTMDMFGESNFTSGGYEIKSTTGEKIKKMLKAFNDATSGEYPPMWKVVLKQYCGDRFKDLSKKTINNSLAETGNAIWNNYYLGVVSFYENCKGAVPGLMAYRFQNQIFSKLVNGKGMSVTNYDPSADNPVTFKAVPVMNFTEIQDMLFANQGVFNPEQIGDAMSNNYVFNYPQCVIDLNPTYSQYKVKKNDSTSEEVSPTWGFPLQFTSGEDPQDPSDVYKTTKILLNRVAAFSGSNSTTFSMGSRTSYYDVISNPYKYIYKDPDAIREASRNDTANVTLFTGGSYQKKDAFWEIQKPYQTDPNNKKYKKNKHFYIDPFELTIA